MAPRLHSGSRVLSSLVLLLAACACFSPPQHAAARLLERKPSVLQTGPVVVPAEAAAVAPAPAVTAEDSFGPKAPLAKNSAASSSRSSSTAAASKQKLPPAAPAAAKQHPARPGSIPASKAVAASRAAAVVASTAAAAVREGSSKAAAKARSHVTEGLPPMIPLPLLLGESKFNNPQVRTLVAA